MCMRPKIQMTFISLFLCVSCRASDQVLLLHRPEKYPRQCSEGRHAFPRQLRQG